MTSRWLHDHFDTFTKILHHNCIDQSTMVKQIKSIPSTTPPAKFAKWPNQANPRTQPQFQFEKIPFSRKVSEQQKQRLIQLITCYNFNMISAAKAVKISYSSAKKIFTRFRRHLREQTRRKAEDTQSAIRAIYTFARLDLALQPTRVQTITMIAGVEVGGEGGEGAEAGRESEREREMEAEMENLGEIGECGY